MNSVSAEKNTLKYHSGLLRAEIFFLWARQEILKIEICTWNQKTNFFLMFIRLPSEVLKTIKKYSFLQK